MPLLFASLSSSSRKYLCALEKQNARTTSVMCERYRKKIQNEKPRENVLCRKDLCENNNY